MNESPTCALRRSGVRTTENSKLSSIAFGEKARRSTPSGIVEAVPRSSARKTTTHPSVGDLTLDCEVLTVTGSDLRIIVFTAAPVPGTPTTSPALNGVGAPNPPSR